MVTAERCTLLLPVLLAVVHVVTAYPYYQDRIPNGDEVFSPCNTTMKWKGVGHTLIGGGGARNPFGIAFAANGHTWTESLCRADSDGDGKTNGEELGDPNCMWTMGEQPSVSPAPSHPGVCEPLGSAQCQDKNSFLNCEAIGFKCPAIEDEGVFTHRVGFMEKIPVPSKDTTYMCQGFDLPSDQDYHLVATESIIDNMNVAHHIVVYGCNAMIHLNESKKVPFDCFMGDSGCSDIIAVWSFGQEGNCYHEDIGFRVGASGYKQVIFEMHWNNPEMRDDYEDSSTMILYLTPTLRPYDAGVLITGAEDLIIPPQETLHSVPGFCSADCLSQLMVDPIKVVGVFNHMHLLGVGMEAEIERTNGVREVLANDMPYDYNYPVLHELEQPINVYRGDSVHITCHFNSMARQTTTFLGQGTYDEMCYTLLIYYPKENLRNILCTSFGEYDTCAERNTEDTINGCKPEYRQPDSPEMVALKERLDKNCVGGMCLKECLPVAREIYENPCFNGTLRSLNMVRMATEQDPAVKYLYYDFWYKADSCIEELQQTEKCTLDIRDNVSAASSLSLYSVFLLVTFILTTHIL